MFQGSLFGDTQTGVDETFARLGRRALDERCWIDFAPDWLAGADDTFSALVEALDWQQRTVTMYERRLPEPRLTSWWSDASGTGEPLPVLGRGPPGAQRRLRRALRHDRVQLVSRRQRLGGVARRSARSATPRVEHRHRQRGRPSPVPPAAARRRALDLATSSVRRPARDGRRLPAPLAALRPEAARRRGTHLDHVPPQRHLLIGVFAALECHVPTRPSANTPMVRAERAHRPRG